MLCASISLGSVEGPLSGSLSGKVWPKGPDLYDSGEPLRREGSSMPQVEATQVHWIVHVCMGGYLLISRQSSHVSQASLDLVI